MDNTKNLQNMKKLLNALPGGLGLYRVSLDGRIELLYMNDDYFTWSGFSRKERAAFDGSSTMEAIHPEERAQVQALAVKAVQTGTVQTVICRVLISHERYRWTGIRIKPLGKDGDAYTACALYSDVDELMSAKQELNEAYQKSRESEMSLRMMLDHMPGALVIFEVRNKMLYLRYISEGCEKISGFSAQETYAKHSIDPLTDAHPDSKKFFREHEWDDIQTGKTITYRYQIVCKSGTYKWVCLNLSPVAVGEEILYYGVFRDLDADEFQMVQKQNRYDQLVGTMENTDSEKLVARARLDLDDNTVLYYMHRGFGGTAIVEHRSVDTVLEAVLRSVVSTDIRKNLQASINRHKLLLDFKAGNTSGSCEYQRTDTRGSTLWYELKYSLFANPENNHVIAFVYISDISDRVLENCMMAKLGEEEYDVLGLIDVNTEIFESKSVRGIKSIASSHNIYMKGQFSDVVSQQVLATVSPSEQKELEAKLTVSYICEQLAAHDAYQMSFFAYRKNHECRRKKMNFCYLDDSKAFVFYYCTDITEAFNREQEQLRMTELALEQARMANASKTDFLSRMSHDMRTPMNGILGLAGLSAEEQDVAVLHENMRRIHDSGKYLLSLINDTLDFQRIESGKMTLEKHVVSAADVLSGIVAVVRPSMEAKHLTFQVNNENADLSWNVLLDEVRFKQIFINLLSNSVKFTPEGGTITFSFGCTGRDGMCSHSYIRVEDTGIGMSAAFLENSIFQPFSQESSAISAQYAGSGLGLSIVKRLVELMDGRIEVESTLGKGSTFTILMDFECVDRKTAEQQIQRKQEQLQNAQQQLDGKHVLLAEDHPLNAEIAQKLLEKAGCTVCLAENGKAALDAVQNATENTYDLILMDIRMPIMNGLEAAKAIRALNRADVKTVPIVAMTANAFDDDVRECLNAGMNGHISKPIEPEVMYQTIAAALQKQ